MAVFYRCDLCRSEKSDRNDLLDIKIPQVNQHGQVVMDRTGEPIEYRTKEVEVCNSCAQQIANLEKTIKDQTRGR